MATLSLSQSFSNSLIEHQHRYEHRHHRHGHHHHRHHRHHHHHHHHRQQQHQSLRQETLSHESIIPGSGDSDGGLSTKQLSETQDRMSVLKQFMLTFVSFGYSCSVEFEAIYGVMSMQYFGLPLYLVSLPGLISGPLNCFLVPCLGHYSDRGPVPLKRKLGFLALTTCCLVFGYSTLAACSWVKLFEMGTGDEQESKSNTTTWTTSTNYSIDEYGSLISIHDTDSRPSNTAVTAMNNNNVSLWSYANNDTDKTNGSSFNFTPNIITTANTTTDITTNTEPNTNSALNSDTNSESNAIPTIAILSVLPFVLYDTGYDTCMSMSRASVLEVVPSHHRNSVLTMAGQMTAFAGIVTAILGIIDFPRIFGSLLGGSVDGFALTLILFSVVYAVCGTVSSACTLVSTWKAYGQKYPAESSKVAPSLPHPVSKSNNPLSLSQTESYQEDNSMRMAPSIEQQQQQKQQLPRVERCKRITQMITGSSLSLEKVTKEEEEKEEEGVEENEETRVCLQEGTGHNSAGYRTFGSSVALEALLTIRTPEQVGDDFTHSTSSSNKINNTINKLNNNDTISNTTTTDNNNNKNKNNNDDDDDNDLKPPAGKTSSSQWQLSASKSYDQALGRIHLKNLKTNSKNNDNRNSHSIIQRQTQKQHRHQFDQYEQEEQVTSQRRTTTSSSVCNLRFCVCWLAIFLCGIATNSTTLYQSNTLTKEVMGGDPRAVPGTPARMRYVEGIRFSSFGMLAAYISFFLFLAVSPRLIARFGVLNVFITMHIFTAVATSVYYMHPGLETYYVMMTMYGFIKAVLLAIAYILATLYAPIDIASGPESGNGSSNGDPSTTSASSPLPSNTKVIGQVMAIVSVNVPAGYILLSAIVGPWMEASGSAWPPTFFSIGGAVGAVITGIVLKFLK